jgi:hypothetical protein
MFPLNVSFTIGNMRKISDNKVTRFKTTNGENLTLTKQVKWKAGAERQSDLPSEAERVGHVTTSRAMALIETQINPTDIDTKGKEDNQMSGENAA